ncbi:MAG: hypothetical protein KDC84_07250, partial [Crocinitomicaceae bacterium]|nr:hypothetical protein [Crocinitomicaceae bacterium]
SLILFGFKVNFTHSIFWSYEHFDKELLTKMEPEIQGIPPTTGGRFWTMDNELTRTTSIPGRVLQDVQFPQDTILDYLVLNKGVLPEVHSGLYERIHEDPISKIQLFKRKNFLNRQFVESKEFNFDTVEEFIGVFNRIPEGTYIIRVKGYLEEMNIHRRPLLVVSLDDNKKSQNYTYLAYNFVESLPIDESKQIHFDLTFGVNQFPEANSLSVYFWNTKKFQLKGKGIVEIYEIVK